MTSFNADAWRSRAHKRYERAQARGAEDAHEKWNSDVRHVAAMEALVAWCAQRQFKVEFTSRISNGKYISEEKLIQLNSTMSPANQVCTLLHECGHYLSEKSSTFKSSKVSKPRNPWIVNTNSYRVKVLEEELDAWSRGLKLAKKLGLDIDYADYENNRVDSVYSYVRWAARDNSFESSVR